MNKLLIKKKTVKVFALAVILTTLAVIFNLPTNAATWDISGSTFTHDPSIIREGDTWWQFYTANGIGVKYSSDGQAWRDSGPIFTSNLSWWTQYVPDKTDRNIWAPDVYYYKNRYWVYYSVSTFGSNTSCIGLTSCSSIAKGDWRDDGHVINSANWNNYNCIDACLTEDKNGGLWLAFGSFWDGIKMISVNKQTMKPETGAGVISLAGRGGGAIEAPYITYSNGYYYLFVSFDKCCSGTDSTYKIVYGRSGSITGPYVDQNDNKMLNGGGTILDQTDGRWTGPGGQSVCKNGSDYLLVHHAYDAYNNGTATLRIKDLYFDSDGWPSYDPPLNPPTVSVTSPADGTAFTEGDAITVSADATDKDGEITLVEFYADTVKIGEDAGAPYSITWNNAAAGHYVITAKATDNSNTTAASAAVTITVITGGQNVSPTVSITHPVDGDTVVTGADITIDADASDSDGEVVSVAFYADGIKLGEDATAPYSFTWTGAAAGNHTITAVATDNESAAATSTAVTVSVTDDTIIYKGITPPFVYDGSGEFYWKTSDIPGYINSWCLDELEINGVDITNTWKNGSSLPPMQGGYYYIHYRGSYNWSHCEFK